MCSKKKNQYCDYGYIGPPNLLVDQYQPFPDQLKLGSEPGLPFGCGQDYNDVVGMHQGAEGHTIVIGGSGCGKSSGIAKPAMKQWEAPFCAVDIKGELSDRYIELYNNKKVKRPYIVFDMLKADSLSYDPLWWIMKDSPDNLVKNILEIVYAFIPNDYDSNSSDKFWMECERAVFEAAVLYYHNLGMSFSQMICLILEESTSQLCRRLLSSDNPIIKNLLGQITDMKEETIANIDRGLRNRLMTLATDVHITHAFRGSREGANCFNWDDLGKYNIFFRIPEDRIEQWGCAINLMFTQLIRYLERRPEKYICNGSKTQPILLLMDEFPSFGKIELMANAISTLRSKNVNICLMIQSIAQLDKIYGPYDRRIIMDNCKYKVILGANDPETAQYLSDMIGTYPKMHMSYSANYDNCYDPASYSNQIHDVREYRVFPDELSRLHDVILITPYGVIRTCKIPFFMIKANENRLRALTDLSIRYKCDSNKNSSADYTTAVAVDDRPDELLTEIGDIKMLTIDERLKDAEKCRDDAERKEKLKAKEENETARKKDWMRVYNVGLLVLKYFPVLRSIDPGINKDETAKNFASFEDVLEVLADDTELVRELVEKANATQFFSDLGE